MSGPVGGESLWSGFLRGLVLVAAAFAAGVALSLAYLWWRGSLDALHLAYCFYFLGALVAAGYVLVMLGANSAIGMPGLMPPAYAYYPLDQDLTSGRRGRQGEMERLTLFVFTLVVLFWGGGAIAELYL